MNRFHTAVLLSGVCLALGLWSCAQDPHEPQPFDGNVWATSGTVDHFNRFHAFSVGSGPQFTYDITEIERRAVELVANARSSVDVALDNFESTRLADAIIEAKARGLNVRVVGDEDRKGQDGFRRLEDGGVQPVYGDGAVTWQAVFGRELVQRAGDDNLMTHNFIIADQLRVLNLTGGFPLDGDEGVQTGFIQSSEEMTKDFVHSFDQMHGGIFATAQTFYDDSVSSDRGHRTTFPTEDGVVELYFGPQERLVKELIDRVYSARVSVFIAAAEFRNRELARALRYKAEAGFDVRLVTGQPPAAPTTGISDVRSNPAIDGTIVIFDGGRDRNGVYWGGNAVQLSMPIFEAVPYYFEDAAEANPLPQRSDRFTDANMWAVHENTVNRNDDFTQLVNAFNRLFEDGSAP